MKNTLNFNSESTHNMNSYEQSYVNWNTAVLPNKKNIDLSLIESIGQISVNNSSGLFGKNKDSMIHIDQNKHLFQESVKDTIESYAMRTQVKNKLKRDFRLNSKVSNNNVHSQLVSNNILSWPL